MAKRVKIFFWLTMISFVFMLSQFFIPAVKELLRGSLFFLVPFFIFFLLGFFLLIFSLKEKKTKDRKYFVLTGASSVGFFVGIIMHNMVYALFIYFFGLDFWDRTGLGDEPFFFFVSLIVCPFLFLIGAIGAIYSLVKKKKS